MEQLQKSIDTLQISENVGAADTVAPDVVPTGAVNGHVSHDTACKVEEKPNVKPTPEMDELAEHLKAIKFKEIKPVELKTNVPTTFHLANKEINKPTDVLACLVKLIDYEPPNEDYSKEQDAEEKPAVKVDSGEKRYFNEKLFMSEKDLKELIDEESECWASDFNRFSIMLTQVSYFAAKNHHIAHTASIGAILLPQIGFRLKEEILQRIASKRLTEQLVALAPSVSYE